MRKIHFLTLLLIVILGSSASCTKSQYKDGVYSGESQSRYSKEPFWGQAKIEIKNNKIISVKFQIIDKANKEVFGPNYEKHYAGNPEYIQQCRNELKGIEKYTAKYIEDGKVDGISGATWSYNFFTAAVQAALKKAENN